MEARTNASANAEGAPREVEDQTPTAPNSIDPISEPISTSSTSAHRFSDDDTRALSIGSMRDTLQTFWRSTADTSDEAGLRAALKAAANETPEAIISESKSDEQEEEEFRPDWRFHSKFVNLCLLTLIVAIDATSLSVALPVISRELDLPILHAFWAGTSFLLTSCLSQPILAALSHVFGRVRLTLASLAIFTLGSILAALSKNFTFLLAGRALQGFGAGGLISITEIIITDIVPLRARGEFYGYLAGTWAVGSVCGPLIGGALSNIKAYPGTMAEGWRWIFWFNVPIAVLASIAIPLLLRLERPMMDKNTKEKWKAIDWVGAVLLTSSTTSFLVSITWAGVQYRWLSAPVLAPLLLGLVGFAMFLLWELKGYHNGEPLIQLAIFNSPTAAVSYFGILAQGIILWALLYYLPLYYEACKGYSPLISGVAILPETLTVAPVAFATGYYISNRGKYTPPIFVGWAITTLGLGLMYLLDEKSSKAKWIGLNILPGLGLGLLFPGLEYATQAAAGQKDVAHAAAMYNFIRAFGQSVGVAIGGSIFQSQFLRLLLKHPELFTREAAQHYAKDAAALVQILKIMGTVLSGHASGDILVAEGSLDQKEMIVKSYAEALQVLWLVMAGLAGLAGLASYWTGELGIDEHLESKQGLKRKKKKEETTRGVQEQETIA